MMAFTKNLGSWPATHVFSKPKIAALRLSFAAGMIAARVSAQSVVNAWTAAAQAGEHLPLGAW
jgi:hypothetical protein